MSAVIPTSLKVLFSKDIIEAIHTQDSGQAARLSNHLRLAADAGNTGIAELLIMHGAEINVENESSVMPSPLRNAIRTRQDNMVWFLLQNNADVHSALDIFAAEFSYDRDQECSDMQNLLRLFEFGVIIDLEKEYTLSYPLRVLRICQGYIADAKSLLKEVAKKEVSEKEIIDFNLIEKIVNRFEWSTSARRKGDENSALHIAVETNQENVVTLLLSKAPRLNLKNAKGDTPLHIAVRQGHTEIVRKLLNAGAEMYVFNNADPKETAESLARNHKNPEIDAMFHPEKFKDKDKDKGDQKESATFLPLASAAIQETRVMGDAAECEQERETITFHF